MKEYYYEKLLQAICFTNDTKIYLNENVLNPTFFKKVRNLLVECNQCAMIDEGMKENLLDLTDYLRYNGYPELANEFIILINKSDVNYFCWEEFLNNEFEKSKILERKKFDVFDMNDIENLFNSLEMDYFVLESLLCDDETFENDFVSSLMLDEFYFISCKRLFEEMPQLFENKKICERISVIHLCNEKIKKDVPKEQTKDYKRVLKVGKKTIKKVIN